MKQDILPKGLNYKDIWGTFKEANRPGPCEHCGKQASSKSLTLSRKVWGMDLCVDCSQLRAHGQLNPNPERDLSKQSAIDNDGYEDKSLPF